MGNWFSYLMLILAVFCIAGQFLTTKLYQNCVKQALITSLFFVLLSSVVTLIMFWVYNGFTFGKITAYSLVLAVVVSAMMVVYNVISIKILSLGEVSIYSWSLVLFAQQFRHWEVFCNLWRTKRFRIPCSIR